MEDLRNEGWEATLDQFCQHFVVFSLGAVCRISAQDLSEKTGIALSNVESFLRSFTVVFGEIAASFVLPSATSAFLKRPLISSGDTFVRINNDLYSYILPRVEQLLNPNGGPGSAGSQRQWERYHRKRDNYLERKAMEQFKRIMPRAAIESSLSYPIPGDGSGAIAELDCLVVHDNNFIFVEAKATSISDSTRRGSTLKMQADSRKGISKGAQQAARAAKYVTSADNDVVFTRKDGSEIKFSLPPIRNCFHVVVTLDHMDALFVNSTALSQIGLTPEVDNFWAVGIRDLMVFADVIEFPTQLLHYIERRSFSLQKHRVFVADELDLLCYYLSQGLYFENMFDSKSANIQLTSNTQVLDDYYYFERGIRETPAIKPKQELPDVVYAVISGMERTGLQAGSEATRILLSMSGDARNEFAEGILASTERCRKTRTNRSIAMAIGDYGVTYFVFPQGEVAQSRAIVSEYLKRKRVETDAHHWVAMCAALENPHEIFWCAVASSAAQSKTV